MDVITIDVDLFDKSTFEFQAPTFERCNAVPYSRYVRSTVGRYSTNIDKY